MFPFLFPTAVCHYHHHINGKQKKCIPLFLMKKASNPLQNFAKDENKTAFVALHKTRRFLAINIDK